MEKAKLRWKRNKKGKKVYYLVVMKPDALGIVRERWERIGDVSKALVEKTLDAVKGEIVKKKFKLPREQLIIPFVTMTEDYLKYSKTNNSARTYEFDKGAIKNFLSYEGFQRPIHEIQKEQVEGYKTWRVNQHSHIFVIGQKTRRHITKETVNREMNTLASLFRVAKDFRKIEYMPEIERFKLDKRKKDYLRLDEVFAIYQQCTPWANLVYTFFLNTGARKSEVTDLKISEINFENSTIKLFGKGGKDRIVDMPDILFEICHKLSTHFMQPDTFEWKKRSKQHQHVFCHDNGGPMVSIDRPIKRAAKRAGIHRRIYLHLLRHTYGTHLCQSGVDLRTIQELMGHESITTTQQYIHADREHQKASIQKLPFGRKPGDIVPLKKRVKND